MAKEKKPDTSFDFGANTKPKKSKGSGKKKSTAGNRSWWTAYTGSRKR